MINIYIKVILRLLECDTLYTPIYVYEEKERERKKEKESVREKNK